MMPPRVILLYKFWGKQGTTVKWYPWAPASGNIDELTEAGGDIATTQ